MSKFIQQQLGKRIQQLRKSKGFSQEKFAEAIGIAPTSLSYIETGNGFLTAKTLENIVDVLNIEPYELFIFNDLSSVLSKEEMFNYIQERLNSIKNDSKLLKSAYIFFKGLI